MLLFKTVPTYFMAIYLFLKLLKFSYNTKTSHWKVSRRHLINSFDMSPKFWVNVISARKCKKKKCLQIYFFKQKMFKIDIMVLNRSFNISTLNLGLDHLSHHKKMSLLVFCCFDIDFVQNKKTDKSDLYKKNTISQIFRDTRI